VNLSLLRHAVVTSEAVHQHAEGGVRAHEGRAQRLCGRGTVRVTRGRACEHMRACVCESVPGYSRTAAIISSSVSPSPQMSSMTRTSTERRAMAAAAAWLGTRSRQNGESSQPPSGARLRAWQCARRQCAHVHTRHGDVSCQALRRANSAARSAQRQREHTPRAPRAPDGCVVSRISPRVAHSAARAPRQLPAVALQLRQALHLRAAELEVAVDEAAHHPHGWGVSRAAGAAGSAIRAAAGSGGAVAHGGQRSRCAAGRAVCCTADGDLRREERVLCTSACVR
jgi:hypothetical protein